jgi:hypothetical protein
LMSVNRAVGSTTDSLWGRVYHKSWDIPAS